ncbi:zinc finger domain-containing protein [Microtetraspora malaysiensis]|uniref:zinc finger domain-containing protein n=1 Tax=Microtetraspora malaysiensis TaxID=161358 RepID=UPI003D9473B9
MNIEDTADILATCAAYDARTVGEADILAWHQIIGDLPYEQARDAVVEHYRAEHRRIMPADVRARVKAIRERLIARAPIPQPSPDPGQYRAELAATVRALADGRRLPAAITRGGDSTPSADYLAARGSRDTVRLAALQVVCPWDPCRAAVGRGCVGPDGRPLTNSPAHASRLAAAGIMPGAAA